MALGAGGLACFGDEEIQLTGELFCEIADVDPHHRPDMVVL